ncbi:MAG: hypothetical protein ACXVAX_11085 [Pseudobdellovibrio sp.]
MKMAYIASNLNVLDSLKSVEGSYNEIDVYLLENINRRTDIVIEELPKLVDGLTLSPDPDRLTEKQQTLSKKISVQNQNLLNSVYITKNISEREAPVNDSIKCRSLSVSDIVFIKYNREIKKISIENSQNEITDYDLLLIENNQFVMAGILDKQQNLFNSFTEQEKCWLTLVFETKNLHKNKQLDKHFIFIENSNISSLDDNWYLTERKGDLLQVALLIPFEMQNNQEYIEFLNKRITDMINERLVALNVVKLKETFVLPTDGYFSYRAKLRQTRQTALVPGFYFWKQNKINSYLNNLLKQKTAKNDPTVKKGILS